MANIINGTDTGSGGLITTGDSSDELQLQTAETARVTLTNTAVVVNEGGNDVDFRVESDTIENALFVDGATGNVGIGTDSPAYKLQITETDTTAEESELTRWTTASGGVLGFVVSDKSVANPEWFLRSGTSEKLNFAVGTTASPAITINGSSNVGIGTTDPIGNLHVSSSGTPTVYIKTSADSGQDATLIIGGARTSSDTSDIGAVQFRNYSIQSTGGAYTLSQISGTDPVADYTQQHGNLTFKTSNAGTLNIVSRMRWNGEFLFNSGYGSAAVAYGCRAWAYVDGDASPVSFLGEGNFSSVTSTTGVYTFSFSTAMPDTNYAVIATVGGDSIIFKSRLRTSGYNTTSFVVEVEDDTDTLANSPQVFVAVFR